MWFALIFNFIISFLGLLLVKKRKIIKYARVLQYANIVLIILCLFIILLLFSFVDSRVDAIRCFFIYILVGVVVLIFNIVILLLNYFSKEK